MSAQRTKKPRPSAKVTSKPYAAAFLSRMTVIHFPVRKRRHMHTERTP